ncbi:GSCOCG00011631001-RA-CDS [Cotesia congregata]|uniref:Similar to RWDD4: RWD domain-containing protein 4 (Homo sapiens) n=1 Tax=Cotesia congregata TaxID=51543 RepID=A0A8J2HAJ7_COTCN|nr:GSCOCG00011631001-RA-CDS [Cotesia congregata]CAG5090855.1 Similar to RWDD4: RWD domain-containing protein 4 (Homo sapiens) [Cotesia congregata]
MCDSELQDEEREALLSIYEGDNAFKQLNSTTYQYKYGEDNDFRSFLLEIIWHDKYPTKKPTVSMDTFYNKHILQKVKDKIIAHVEAEAEQWLGYGMTYTLFQSVQEHLSELLEEQPDSITDISIQTNKLTISTGDSKDEAAKKPKKEQLTKSQKRRRWNKVDSKGEKPRGWDWVDIVKHLSQTGMKTEQET